MSIKRILLIGNKSWEVEPILNALLNVRMRPSGLPDPTHLNYPWTFLPGSPQPRAIWDCFPQVTIELWCIQDIMDTQWNPSSSQGKHACLPKALYYRQEKPDLVVALGTAALGLDGGNNNGCVVMGSNIFIHNFHPNGENIQSQWDDPKDFEKVLHSAVSPDFFQLMDNTTVKAIESRLLKPYLHPSDNIGVMSDKDYIGVSVVNITNYADYKTSDQEGLKALAATGNTLPVGSVETTHGVIRLLCDAPFVFMSGITDREGYFDEDVNGQDANGNVKTEAQNFTAAFNIGVCLGHMIPKMASFVTAKQTKPAQASVTA
ncbi:hypothetical protein [Chitinophaga flava]|uniref:Nucleoside phosphorylase domain-containing protein n=1 Tax=Chitinophaga flava TaxID=2259036 RepID=A0A365XSA1_9BACT|nr:hypothetical protein [Chitinophaga flava]RBL88998.1 hypothetical protein DF182_20875 [Chitinophaga flava]